MALTFGFYNSLDGDRRYDTVQISQIFDGIINDGVFQSIGDFFATKPSSGLSVTVGTGRAWFNHTWTLNDALIPLTVDAADPTLTRIDAVVLEVDSSELVRANSIKIVKGTAASDPVKPVMTNTDTLHQHPLAYITVKPGMTEIKASEIEVMVGKSECPFVTAILETTDIDAVFAQWESQFTAWFENVQSQLEGDIATNLQRQIDAINQKDQTSGVFYKEAKPYVELQKWDGTKLKTPEGWQVGDILVTARRNLGKSWLLCNGDQINPAEYPKLGQIMEYNWMLNLYRYKVTDFWINTVSQQPSGVYYVNGKLVIIIASVPTSDFWVSFKDYPDGEWETHKAVGITGVGNSNFNEYYVKVRYVDGKYLLIHSYSRAIDNSDSVLTVLQSTDLINWSELEIPLKTWISGSTSYGAKYPRDIIQSDEGPILVVALRQSSSYYGNRTIIDSLSDTIMFTNILDFEAASNSVHCSYAHGKFFLSYFTSDSKRLLVDCYTISSKSWTASTIIADLPFYGVEHTSDVVYHDGFYWLVANGYIFYSANGEDWNYDNRCSGPVGYEVKNIIGVVNYKGAQNVIAVTFNSSGYTDTYIKAMLVDVAAKNAIIMANQFPTRGITTGDQIQTLALPNGLSTYVKDYGDKRITEVAYSGYDSVKLPTNSIDSAYEYIRALEE